MPLIYDYPDAYLHKLLTEDIESRALADVQAIRSDFPALWLGRLTVLRAYIVVCMESVRTADDLFTVKLAQYRKEFGEQLGLARIAADQAAAEGGGETSGAGSLFSIALNRS